ncbi:MAG: excinuclease ABC subunit UvrA, partial [bacterium]
MNEITISGARVHNLKNLSVSIPRNRMVVFTGMSGSGKTSLAYDTIFSEGRRRYFETLSAYFRQFVVGMDRPDVDLIEGLSPSISVDQRGRARSGRSTVGTITETADYLRLLFTAIAKPYCPDCGIAIEAMTPERMVEAITDSWKGRVAGILAPVVVGRKGTHKELIEGISRRGYQKIRV